MDDESLSVLDLDAIPDARRSVSLVHVDNKSSIGSFIDHCFSSTESERPKSAFSLVEQMPCSDECYRSPDFDASTDFSNQHASTDTQPLNASQQLNEIFLHKLQSPFATGSDDSNNSEFDFDADELDIDILINEEDGDLNDTLVKKDEFHQTLSLEEIPPVPAQISQRLSDKDATTLEFLKGLGLAGAPNKEQATTHDVSDGKPSQPAALEGDPFNDMICAEPLDFSGTEFQDGSGVPCDMFPDDQFASAADAEHIFNKEEELFEKEHAFALNENFVAANDESGLRDFSMYRMSSITAQSEDETGGKISIGTYIAKRSDKLGELEGENNVERPSFGLDVKTPSPTKPFLPLGAGSDSTAKNVSTSDVQSDSASSNSITSALSVDLSEFKFDETIDQSLMTGLSKAISDMSASMSNEELAQFIISLSNKKMELQQQSGQVPMEDSKVSTAKEILASTSVHSGSNSLSSSRSSLNSNDVMDSTLKNEDVLEENSLVHVDRATSTSTLNDVLNELPTKTSTIVQRSQGDLLAGSPTFTPRSSLSSTRDNLLSDPDDIASNDTTFSPCSADQRILSSTRANLSLTRGSLSRDSIEKLHRQLRSQIHKPAGGDLNTALPDLVSNQSNRTLSRTSTASPHKSDGTATQNNTVPSFHPPLSQSSPPVQVTKSNDVTLSRLSAAFQKLHPSDTFDELATIAESPVDEDHFSEVFQINTEQKSVNVRSVPTSVNSRDELPSCTSIDPLPKASSTRTSQSSGSSRRCQSANATVDQSLGSQISISSSSTGRSAASTTYAPYPTPTGFISAAPHLAHDAHLYASMHPSLTLIPAVPQQPLSAAHRSIDASVYSSSQACSYAFPHPYQRVPTILTVPSRGNYHDTASYFDDVSPSVSTPTSLNFDSVLCVGVPSKILLPLQNTGSRWIQYLLKRFDHQRPVPASSRQGDCKFVKRKQIQQTRAHPVTNMQAELRCLSISINQKMAPLNNESYLSFKQRHVVGPHSKEDTEITFIGVEPGKYHVVIEIISNLICLEGNRSNSHRCSVSTVSVIANVDLPSVSLHGTTDIPTESRLERLIDFGEVVLGSNKSLPLRILNKGKVEVPLRLLLIAPTHKHSFLSLSSSSIQQEPVNAGSQALRTVLTVSDQPTTVWLRFHSSNTRSFADQSPIKVEGRVEAVLDAPFKSVENLVNFSQVETLDTISVCALVGVGKLHAPRSAQILTFTACRGSSDVKLIPVRNAGNISVHVSFGFENQNGIFSLRPASAMLPPGDDIQLTVEFQPSSNTLPTSHNHPLTNRIFMNILPSGPQFEVEVNGVVTSLPSDVTSSTPPPPPPPNLLTNKNRLRWGGVPIGRSQKQNLVLRTASSVNPIKFRCSIKDDTSSSFQILTSCGGMGELVRHCTMSVLPGQDRIINVMFAPCRKKMIHAKMEIKTPIDELPATKYTIPLSGYGGCSQVRVENLDRTCSSGNPLHNEYVPEIYAMTGNTPLKMVRVLNCGNRSAYVKLVAYSDSSLHHISSSVLCSPSQFVLDERQSRDITLKAIAPLSQSVFISIWHGDELSRMLMRKALSAHPAVQNLIARCVPQSHSYIRTLSFDGIFHGEDNWKEEDLQNVEPHPYDVQLFYHNIKQSLIEILESHNSASASSDTLTSLSYQELPVKDAGGTVELAQKNLPCLPPDVPSNFHLNWSISPTHITLTLPTKSGVSGQDLPEPVRIRIKNHSLASLVYDVIWPGHYITLTPQRGRIDPESTGLLLVNANPSLTSGRSMLPWCGQAVVLATGGGSTSANNSRTIYVQIKEGVVTPPETSSQAESQGGVGSDESGSLPASPRIPKLQVLTNPIDFESVAIGNNKDIMQCMHRTPIKRVVQLKMNTKVTATYSTFKKSRKIRNSVNLPQSNVSNTLESHLEFRNMCKSAIKWMLSSVAPSYVKNPCSKVFRSTYAAFIFSHRSGSLEPAARVQIPVTFNPMNVGLYSQHWEIEYHELADVAGLTLQREQIQLTGKGINSQFQCLSQASSRASDRNDIYVSENSYWFPDTLINRSSVIKIPIKNKGKTSRTVKFVNLSSPFHITHQKHAIRSMCCANLPVTFKPTKEGTFTDILVIRTEGNPDVSVTLKAKANIS